MTGVDYRNVLKQFLDLRGWEDEIDIDEENGTLSVNTEIGINGQSIRLVIEINPEGDIVDVFFYYTILCKKNKINQMAILLNLIHHRWIFGRFEVYETGHIRWRHRCDFEGAQPVGLTINCIVEPGWQAVNKFADVIAAVALTNSTAEEAIAEYDKNRDNEDQE